MKFVLHYNLRQFRVRPWSTVATLSSVALVIGVFCYMLVFADGLRRTLAVTADPRNLVVLAEGATAESNSAVSHDDAVRLAAVPNVDMDVDGRPLVSLEVVVQTNVSRRNDDSGALAGVAVRGLDLDVALSVHPAVTLLEGRWFQSGSDEIVVGHAAARQFREGSIGANLEAGERVFQVVGVFHAAESAHESEFWGHVSNVAAAYRRDMYSCATVRLKSADESTIREAVDRIASATVALRAIPEGPYYAGQTENARIVQSMAWMILSIMSVGAIFAAMNVTYSALVGRRREIGMLRAMGYSRRTLMMGLVGESTFVALVGGLLGCAAVAVVIAAEGGTRDLVGTTTFTSVAFTLHIRVENAVTSLAAAAAIGVLGGVWPAHRATCTPVVQSLRIG